MCETFIDVQVKDSGGSFWQLADHLPDFKVAPAVTVKTELEKLLLALKPDELSPKQALEMVYKIKAAGK